MHATRAVSECASEWVCRGLRAAQGFAAQHAQHAQTSPVTFPRVQAFIWQEDGVLIEKMKEHCSGRGPECAAGERGGTHDTDRPHTVIPQTAVYPGDAPPAAARARTEPRFETRRVSSYLELLIL